MKIVHVVGLFACVLSATALIVACSSDDGLDPGGSSGSSGTVGASGDGGSVGDAMLEKCAVPPGTYSMHYTENDGGLNCNVPSNTTIVVESGSVDAGSGDSCASHFAPNSCQFAQRCQSTDGDLTTITTTTTQVEDATFSGMQTITTMKVSDGSVVSNCSYNFVADKK